MDDLEEDEVDTSLLSVVRCILAAPKVEKEDWRRTSIFQMYFINECFQNLRAMLSFMVCVMTFSEV